MSENDPDFINSIYPELYKELQNWRYKPNANALNGKNVLVTGAGDGIGLSMAKTFALYGANILLLGKTRSKLEACFDWITKHTTTKPTIIPSDLEILNDQMVLNLANLITENYESLDVLINNASMLGPRVPIAHYPEIEWAKVFQINVIAPFVLTKGLFSLLDTGEDSCVINISSSVGRKGRAYWGAYSASKFAIEGFTQTLADETEEAERIRVYSVNPGATRTKMRKEAYPLEDPEKLKIPETFLDLFIALVEGNKAQISLPSSGKSINMEEWISQQ